jgi:hypothetical protein
MATRLFATAAVLLSSARAAPFPWLPITGSFLDVAYDGRLKYANGPAHAFSCDAWAEKVGEWAAAGIDLIVFQAVHDQRWGAYYPSALPFATPWNGTCTDVVGAVLKGADAVGSRVLLTCEYVHGEDDSVTDPAIMSGRLAIMSELAAGMLGERAGPEFKKLLVLTETAHPDACHHAYRMGAEARVVFGVVLQQRGLHYALLSGLGACCITSICVDWFRTPRRQSSPPCLCRLPDLLCRKQFIAYVATLAGKSSPDLLRVWKREKMSVCPPLLDRDAAHARTVTPSAVLFTSPYGTRSAVNDSTFVAQLQALDVDVVAYQDEVGCVRDEVGACRTREELG